MENNNLIAMLVRDALPPLNAFLESWDKGGRERSKVFFETAAKSELQESAPKRTGIWPFNRRDTRPTERCLWAERIWTDAPDLLHNSEGWLAHERAERWLHYREERVERISNLVAALRVTPALTTVYIDANDWEFAHRSF